MLVSADLRRHMLYSIYILQPIPLSQRRHYLTNEAAGIVV